MNKETLLQKRKRKKLFPWLKTFYSKCAEKFLDDNEVQALEYLSVNVDKEIKALVLEPNEKKATELFNILDIILLHLNWKIHWRSFKQWKSYWKKVESPINNTSDAQKRSCTKLLYSLLYLSLLLTNGNKKSEWINRILMIFKIIPSLLDASYSALLLVDNLKKRYSPVYHLVLKYVLLNFTVKNEVSCLLYSKVILLFRRLLKFTKNETERKQILSAASKQHPPHDFMSWLSSIDDNSIKHLKIENVMEEFLSRTYPDDLLRKLQEVLRQEENFYQSSSNFNNVDHFTDPNHQESKLIFSKSLSLKETSQVINEIKWDGTLSSEEIVSPKKKRKGNFNNVDHLTDKELLCPNYQESKLIFSGSSSLNESIYSQVTNEINMEKILSSEETVSPKKTKKKKKREDNLNNGDHLIGNELPCPDYQESKSTSSESLCLKETSQITNEIKCDVTLNSEEIVSSKKIKKTRKDNFNNVDHLTDEKLSCPNYQDNKSTFSGSASLNESTNAQVTNKIIAKVILGSENTVYHKTTEKKRKDSFNNTDNLTHEELSCPNYEETKSTFSENHSLSESSIEKNKIKCAEILNSDKIVSPKKIKKKKKRKDTEMKKNGKNKESKNKKHHKTNFKNRNLDEAIEKTRLKYLSNDNFVEKNELVSNDYLDLHVSQANCLQLSNKQENELCISKCEREKNKHKKKKKKKELKIEDEKQSKRNKRKHHKETENNNNNQIKTNDIVISNSDLEMCFSQTDRRVIPNYSKHDSFVEENSEEMFKKSSKNNVEAETNCSDPINVHKKRKKLKSTKKHKKKSKKTKKKKNKSQTLDTEMLETDSHHFDNNNMCVSEISENVLSNDIKKNSIAEKKSENLLKIFSKDDNVETEIDCSDTINVHKKSKKLKSTGKRKKKSKNTEKKRAKSQTPETQVLETNSHCLDNNKLSEAEKFSSNSDLEICVSEIDLSNIPNHTQKTSLAQENLDEMLENSHKLDNVKAEIKNCNAMKEKSKKRKKELKKARKKKDNLHIFETQLSYIEKDENNRTIKTTIQKHKLETNDAITDIDNNLPKINLKSKMKKLFNAERYTLNAEDSFISHNLNDDAHKKDGPVAVTKLNQVNEIEKDNLSHSTTKTLFLNSELVKNENPSKLKDSQNNGSMNNSSSDSNQNYLDDAAICSDKSISELLKLPKTNIYRNNKALGIEEHIKNKNKEKSEPNLNLFESEKNSITRCHKKRKIDPNSNSEASEDSFNSSFSNNELIVASKNILVQTQASETYGSQSLFEEDINSVNFNDFYKQNKETQLCSNMLNDQTQNTEQVFNHKNSCNNDVTPDLTSNSLTFENPQSGLISSSLHFKISNSKISAKSSTSSIFSLSSSSTISPSNHCSDEMKNTQNHGPNQNEANLLSKSKLFLPYVVLEDIENSFSQSSTSTNSNTFDLQSNISSKLTNACESSCSTANSGVSLSQSQLKLYAESFKTERSPSSLSKSPILHSPCSQTNSDKIPPLIENENSKTVPCFIQNVVKSDNEYESNSLTSFDNNKGKSLITVKNSSIAAPKTITSNVNSIESISSFVPPAMEFFNNEEHSLSSTTEYQSDRNSLFTESEADSKNLIFSNINEEYQNEVNRGTHASIETNTNAADIDITNSMIEHRINNANSPNHNPSSTNVSSIQIIINLNKNDLQLANTNQLITNINFHSSNSYESPVVTNVLLNQENTPVMANDVPVSQNFIFNEASQTVELVDSNTGFLRPNVSLNERSQICTNSDINLLKTEVLQSSPISTKVSKQQPIFSTPLISNLQSSENFNKLNLNHSYPSSIYEDLKIINSQTNLNENTDSLVHSNMNHLTDNIKTPSAEKVAALQLNDSFSKIQDHDSRTVTDAYSSLRSDDLSVSSLSLISDIETELSLGENVLISIEAKDHKRKCLTKKNNQPKCKLLKHKCSKANSSKKAPARKRKKSVVSKSKKVKSALCFDQNKRLLNNTIKIISDAAKDEIVSNSTPIKNSCYNFRNRSSLRKPRKYGNEKEGIM